MTLLLILVSVSLFLYAIGVVATRDFVRNNKYLYKDEFFFIGILVITSPIWSPIYWIGKIVSVGVVKHGYISR